MVTDELRELTEAHPDIIKIDSDTNLSFESKNIGAHPGDEFIADEVTHQLRISANSTVAVGFDESILSHSITGKDLTNSLSRPSIEIEPMGASTVKTIADGNKILFPEILPYIDILHTNTQNGLKEDIILKDEKAARSIDYALTVRDGITPVIRKNEIIFLDKLGKTIAHIPAPFLSDVRGNQSDSAMFELFNGSPEYIARWETEKVIASLPASLLTSTGAKELSQSGAQFIQTGASQTGAITPEISQLGTSRTGAITPEISQSGSLKKEETAS